MNKIGSFFVFCTGVLVALSASAAHAAAPTQVSNWQGGVSLPSDVSMFIYVPTKVVTKPPVLTLIHYCGGNASAVFGQAQGGGLVAAADQYGFIMVVPSNGGLSGTGRCWDVTSSKAQKRDGGGDTHAIMQMVKYALSQYNGNPDRVYSTGDSSGGMTTQLMLALYPDVFKAGSSFAGVPAGCSNVFDGTGLCGLPAQTAQQWGDRVRAMDPGYTGHRPRVQLFHGDADATIAYKNFSESIKEWTSVLSLPTSPTSTDESLTLGTSPTHQATRESWKNACGYVALDAFTEHGGDHGPSDTLFVAKYVVPFLGLDKTGAVDPEIEQCAGGGTGAGGAGAGGTGGSAAGGSATAGSAAGGKAGSSANGGSVGVSGSAGAERGGSPGLGGGLGLAGGLGLGGAPASAGQSAISGSANVGLGGSSAGGSSTGSSPTGDSSGCSCDLGKTSNNAAGTAALAFGLALFGAARRRRRQ